jgi:hypothetical protein
VKLNPLAHHSRLSNPELASELLARGDREGGSIASVPGMHVWWPMVADA